MMRLVFLRGSVLLIAEISLFLLLSLWFFDKFEDNFSLISRHNNSDSSGLVAPLTGNI